MATEIDQLQIEITDSSESAIRGIDALINTLSRLKTISKGGVGLTATNNQLRKLNETIAAMQMPGDKIRTMVEALKPLQTINKSTGLNSTINSLKKLPDLTNQLASIDMDGFAKQIERVTASLRPLGTEMQKISNGFNAFPQKIQRIITQNNRLSSSNRRTSKSFGVFGNGLSGTMAKLGLYYIMLKRVGSVLGGWVSSANEYIENINLFTVSMGKYAEEAMSYAKSVNEAMGIDLSEFIRNQGVFMQIATGFGVVEKQAYSMSKGLTQVSYDIASFFNIPIEEAFTKVQSGISGELEPLRRLGYALDQATLQQIALRYGVETSVTKMNQAQKSYLRYVAIMEQSTKVTGDMARTLITPANAMRILSQQVTQLGRALGNIFIPMLITVIPYVQAFVMVLTQAAQALANLLGFQLPTIDYSSVSGLSNAVDDVDSGLGDATGSAKKLKNILAGFDELNILQTKESSAGSGISSALDSNGLGIDLSKFDYDFLGKAENQANIIFGKITKAVDEFRDKLKPFEPLLEGIATGFLTAFAFKWISGAVSKFGKIGLISAGLTAVKGALTGAIVSFSLAESPLLALGTGFTMLWASFKTFVQGLSPFTKMAIAVVGLVTEFTVAKRTMEEFALGNISLGEALLNIVPIVAVVETVLYAAFGPAGLIIGAIATVAGAIVGFNSAQQKLQDDWIADTFFDGVGTSLDELRSKFELSTKEIQLQASQINSWSDEIKANNTEIDKSALGVQTLAATLGREGLVTQSEIDNIKGQFKTLYETIKVNMNLSDQIIQTALVGALKRATPEIAGQIDLLIGEYMRFVRETQGRSAELELNINNAYDNLVGKAANSPEYKEIMSNINEWYIELGVLSGTMTNAGWEWKNTVDEMNAKKINFGTVDGDLKKSIANVKTDLSEISSAGISTLSEIESAYVASMTAITNQIDAASKYGSQEDVKILTDIQKTIKRDYETQKSGIQSEIDNIFSNIQLQMITSAEGVKTRATDEWNKLNWFEKLWNGGSEASYVDKALNNYKNNLIAPIETSIKTSMDELGIVGSVWATDAMDGVINALFDVDFSTNAMTVSYKSTIQEAIKTSLNAVALSGREDAVKTGAYINAGLSDGISGSISAVDAAINNTANSAINTWKMTTETHSPSQVFTGFGKFITDGLVIGIEGGKNGVVASIQSVANGIITVMSTIVVSISSSVSTIMSSVSSAKAAIESLNNIKVQIPTIPTTAYKSPTNVKMYATGGMPNQGEMFIAREAGAEMVGSIGGKTAVANNDQIVAGISKGVYDAVIMAMSATNQNNNSKSSEQNQETVLVIDDIQFGRIAAKAINNAQRQSGVTLLTL